MLATLIPDPSPLNYPHEGHRCEHLRKRRRLLQLCPTGTERRFYSREFIRKIDLVRQDKRWDLKLVFFFSPL